MLSNSLLHGLRWVSGFGLVQQPQSWRQAIQHIGACPIYQNRWTVLPPVSSSSSYNQKTNFIMLCALFPVLTLFPIFLLWTSKQTLHWKTFSESAAEKTQTEMPLKCSDSLMSCFWKVRHPSRRCISLCRISTPLVATTLFLLSLWFTIAPCSKIVMTSISRR